MRSVQIHYHRPPGRRDIFRQALVTEEAGAIITFMEESILPRPVMANGKVILEPGAPAIWFTFPGLWHDTGRFHLADDTFTGIYTNILTPVNFLDPLTWETTDLFLDHWLDSDGHATILDEDEFAHAVAEGWLDAKLQQRARAEMDQIEELARAGEWPPPIVEEWTLERVRESIERGSRERLREGPE